MAKRIIVFLLIISIMTCTFSSCVELDIYIPPSGYVTPDVYDVPSYTENFTHLPIIEYKDMEFRLDKMLCCEDSNMFSKSSASFDDLEDDIRAEDDAMIVIGTVIDNPRQLTEVFDTSSRYSADVICPIRIEKIVYQSQKNSSAEGDVIEVNLRNQICIVEKQVKTNTECGVSDTNDESNINEPAYDNYRLYVSQNRGIAMISGAQYIMYLYGTDAPDYGKYKRYTIPEAGAFEITDYCESFTAADNEAVLLFNNQTVAGMAIRKYNLQKECGIIYDPSKYQISSSLSSSDDVKTVGIKIGDTIVEGWEYVYNGYKCTEQKNGQYLYVPFAAYKPDFQGFNGYDLSSGILPEGCPVIICESGDEIELIFDAVFADGNYENKELDIASFYNMKGEEIGTFGTETDDFLAGAYWFLMTVISLDGPIDNESVTPVVGEEYVSTRGYLFCIIMD